MSQVLLPAHTNFKIKQSKLNNENAYQFNGFVEGKAFIVSLNEIQHQQKANSVYGKDDEVEEQKAVERKEEAISLSGFNAECAHVLYRIVSYC